jgi:hypothetical protein
VYIPKYESVGLPFRAHSIVARFLISGGVMTENEVKPPRTVGGCEPRASSQVRRHNLLFGANRSVDLRCCIVFGSSCRFIMSHDMMDEKQATRMDAARDGAVAASSDDVEDGGLDLKVAANPALAASHSGETVVTDVFDARKNWRVVPSNGIGSAMEHEFVDGHDKENKPPPRPILWTQKKTEDDIVQGGPTSKPARNAAIARLKALGPPRPESEFRVRPRPSPQQETQLFVANASRLQAEEGTPWILDVQIFETEKEEYTRQSPTPLETGAARFATATVLPPSVRTAHNMPQFCDSPACPPVSLDEPARRSSRLRAAISDIGTMVPAPRAMPDLDFGYPPQYKATTIMFPAPRAEPDLDLDCVIRCIYTSLPASLEQNGKGQEAYNALVETTGEAFAAARHDGSERQVAWRALASFMQQGHCFFKRSKHGTEKWEQAYDRISLAKFLSCLRYNKRKRDATPMDAATSPLSEYEVRRARNIERNNARLLELGLIS